MRRLVAVAVLSLASVAAVAPRAHAQSAAELIAARTLFAEGIDLEKKKDYAGALEKFRKVASIKSTAIVRYHEGYCAEKLGRWIEALDAYARATLEGQGDPKQKDAVDAAHKAADALRPRVPRIRAKVTGTQKGKYQIRIDGTPVSDALLDTPVPVDVGKHLVELSGEGIAPDSQEVTVSEKETRDVVFEAKEPSAAPPPPKESKEPKEKKEPPKGAEPKGPEPKPAPDKPHGQAPSMAIEVGLSLGNIQPAGQIVDPATGNLPRFARGGDSAQLNYVGAGFAFEPRVGFRFLQPLAAYVFWQHGFLGSSGLSNDSGDFSASTDAFGLGLTLLTHPNGKWSGYGDLSLATRTLRYDDRAFGEKATFTGGEVGLKLGVAYKAMPALTLLACGWINLGSYSTFTYEDANNPAQNRDEAIDQTASHAFFGLSLGATWDFALK